MAEEYAAHSKTELNAKPLGRAMLSAFAQIVRATGDPVADIGCGTGDGTALLRQAGFTVTPRLEREADATKRTPHILARRP
ncbi:hypothetical protein [Saccharopolyspora sp. NPDC002376]